MTDCLQLFLQGYHVLFKETILLGLLQGNQRIARDEVRFEIGQVGNTIVLIGIVRLLTIADQRDEKAEFGDLSGNSLNVTSIDAVLHDLEFQIVLAARSLQVLKQFHDAVKHTYREST